LRVLTQEHNIIDIFQGQKRGYDAEILKKGIRSIIYIGHEMDVVMDYGFRIAERTPEEIRTDPKVIKAYLGENLWYEFRSKSNSSKYLRKGERHDRGKSKIQSEGWNWLHRDQQSAENEQYG